MADAWIGVAGTLLGGLLGFGTSTVTERSRWRRQRIERWDPTRLSLYGDLLEAVEQLVAHSQVMLFLYDTEKCRIPATASDVHVVRTAIALASGYVKRIEIVSTDQVSLAAKSLVEVVRAFGAVALEGDQDDLYPLLDRIEECRSLLVASAKRELEKLS